MIKIIALILYASTIILSKGNNLNQKKNRIIGGQLAAEGQFPFVAGIFTETISGTFFCGGSLITSRYVLTSAQCVDGVFSFTVRLGTTELLGGNNHSLTITGHAYYITLGFDRVTLDNDIGLIRLDEPVEFTDFIRPVNVYNGSSTFEYSSVIAVGWGQISDGSPGLENNLKYVHLTTIPNEECKLTYGKQITDNMICAQGTSNQGTCFGDTGGPLLLVSGDTAEVFQIGIASFLSANGCDSPDPSGFLKPQNYLTWITEVLVNIP